jgi:hypothetical protein
MQDITCQHCGNINDYRTIMKTNQNTAWCNGCDKFIKNLPQGKPPQIFFGRYKDRLISSLTSKEEVQYLQWLIEQPWCKNMLKGQIEDHLKSL